MKKDKRTYTEYILIFVWETIKGIFYSRHLSSTHFVEKKSWKNLIVNRIASWVEWIVTSRLKFHFQWLWLMSNHRTPAIISTVIPAGKKTKCKCSECSAERLMCCVVLLNLSSSLHCMCVCVCRTGSQTHRPAAAHHRLRPLWLRPRPGPLPVPQQPAEVHRDLRSEGKKRRL